MYWSTWLLEAFDCLEIALGLILKVPGLVRPLRLVAGEAN